MAQVIFNDDISTDKFGVRPKNDTLAIAETPILDHGKVALLAVYGSDALIADTARMSYGKGTKTSSSDTGLIRYLMRHRHTSPIEHAEVVFFLRVPIFVARQLVRHRTANINEYSARYSELSEDYYVPEIANIARQSELNKQGRDETLSSTDAMWVRDRIDRTQHNSLRDYQALISAYDVSRELSRVVSSVGTYTEMYWKCDLHNFLHFLKLRMDSHAQYEIRVMAEAMCACAKPFFPDTFAAWEDYVLNARTLSAMELKSIADFIKKCTYGWSVETWSESAYPKKQASMSAREYNEFKQFMDFINRTGEV